MAFQASISSFDEQEFEQKALWNIRNESAFTDLAKEPWELHQNDAATQRSDYKSYLNEDASTELRTLEENEGQVLGLILKISRTRSIPYRESIAKRLFELLRDVQDEGTENAVMSVESLRSFYCFLQTHSNLKRPAMGLTPANEIYVSWKAGVGSIFSIHFLSSGLVRFVIITPNPSGGQPFNLSGSSNIESLMEKVKPWGVLKWAGHEG